jgi:hypothetical protein
MAGRLIWLKSACAPHGIQGSTKRRLEMPMNALNGFLGSRPGLAVTLLVSALGVYLLATHTGHALAALPYLLLLACPLMHLFGHRHHSGHTSATSRPTEPR